MFNVLNTENVCLLVQANGKVYSTRFADLTVKLAWDGMTKIEGTLFELKEISKYTPFDLNEEDVMNILTEE